jgi:hypothetical protein
VFGRVYFDFSILIFSAGADKSGIPGTRYPSAEDPLTAPYCVWLTESVTECELTSKLVWGYN